MNKKLGKDILAVLFFLLILGTVLYFADKILQYKEGTDKYQDFYREKSQFDVLFFGSSRVLDGFQPMELWEDFGIRSYNMAQHAEGLARDYWQLKNAFAYNIPRAVVVDISAFNNPYELNPDDENDKGALHKQIDHMPRSFLKLKMLKEICPGNSCLEYLFPFITYHSRWNNLSVRDFELYHHNDNQKGAEFRTWMEEQERPVWQDDIVEETVPMEDLKIKEMIDLCAEKGVELIFVSVPFDMPEERMPMINWLEQYFIENDVTFINYQKNEDFLDYGRDFNDFAHVNLAGSLKLTKHFGQFFVDHYGVTETDEENKARWNEMLSGYKEKKEYYLMQAERNVDVLMLTYQDDDYEVKVYTNPERMHYTGTDIFFPEMEGIEGMDGYRIEVYRRGEPEILRIWECE